MGICGIDEAGRGPMAGPLVIAGAVLKEPIVGLDDSKKLTEKRRETLFDEIIQKSDYTIVFVDNVTIDKKGLSFAIRHALTTIQEKLPDFHYLFDGNSAFGVSNIEPIIKGDTKIDAIKAASILAKVSRDRHMVEMSETYPAYGFEKHKGYITKFHKEAVLKHGYCPLHRRSYKVKGLS